MDEVPKEVVQKQSNTIALYLSAADKELLCKAFKVPVTATGKAYKPLLLEYARKTLEGGGELVGK